MQPDNFEDISAALALYRPGPMGVNAHTNFALRKNGKQAPVPLDPQLEGKLQPEMVEALGPILGTTYGLVIYQEQVMEIAQKLAGYTLGNADLLRRAMGKKKKEVLDAEYVPFSEGMKAKGFNEASIAALWGVLVPFSDYAFNKAHTAAYGLVSYWTAYLKANYPAEYMAALLTSVGDDKDKSALYLGECRRMGIKVLPPDVNDSIGQFAAVGTDIRFGMQAIRNVGHNVVEAIVAAREEKGRFTSFRDFMSKVPAVVCNKRTIESLIKGGAFDGLAETRMGLLRVHEEYVDAFVAVKRQEAIGQDSLFGAFGDDSAGDSGGDLMGLTAVPGVEWDKSTLLSFEREMLGLYVSDHPLFGVEHVLTQHADTPIAALTSDDAGQPEGSMVTIAGPDHRAAGQAHQEGRPLGDRHGRGPRRRHRVPVLPQRLHDRRPDAAARTPSPWCAARSTGATTRVSIYAQELTLPDVSEGPRGPGRRDDGDRPGDRSGSRSSRRC